MRRIVALFTALSVALSPAAGRAGPHEEGLAAGRAANPVARDSLNEGSARSVVPGYTTAPPEASHYREPNLAAQGSATLARCASRPNDPVCQALVGANASASTPRPGLGFADPAVAGAAAIQRSPASVLEGIASYYSGCTTTATAVPAGTQVRSCLRYDGIGRQSCTRSLTVSVDRSPSCTPGDWFAHAASGRVGVDVQCLPDRPATAQHFRVTSDGEPIAFFDVDMTEPVVQPQKVATIANSLRLGLPDQTAVWVADRSCSGDTCTLTTLLAPERIFDCTGNADSGITCTIVEPFSLTYAACPAGTQSGDRIVDSVCNIDGVCTSTNLDGTRCYAPAAGATALTGFDVTGTVPGYYWAHHSDRTVTGWAPNPEFGPIPSMALSYTRPSTTVTTTDRWDDPCPAVGGRCTVRTSAVCTDGPSTKTIDGVALTRDCWRYETTMDCTGSTSAGDCAALAAAGCTPSSSVCRRTDPATGACQVWEDGYRCPVPAQTTVGVTGCPSNVFCLQGNCFDIRNPQDGDFARSVTMLEAAREAGVYLDTDRMRVFAGEDSRCRDRLLGNCCYADGAGAGMTNQSLFGTGSRLVYDLLMNAENQQFVTQGLSALLMSGGFSGTFTSYGVTVAINGAALPAGSLALYAGDTVVLAFDPWSLALTLVIYAAMSAMSCDEQEAKLALKEGARLCRTIGTYCSSCIRVLGRCVACIEHTTRKCCFNSVLARLVNEQGRLQVGKGWGTAQSPDCSGFTVTELQALDFGAMDLSEFYASLVTTMPGVSALQEQSRLRVPSCYYGQGKCQ